jgi:hypothetical protein
LSQYNLTNRHLRSVLMQEFAFSDDFPSGVQKTVRERGPELLGPDAILAQWPAVVQQSKIADPKAWSGYQVSVDRKPTQLGA